MTTTDTIEGTINGTVAYRYDAFTDVLYLKRLADEDVETYADVTGDSDLLLRDPATDRENQRGRKSKGSGVDEFDKFATHAISL
jgi:hypothetical protein